MDRQLVADIVQKYHGMVAGCIAAGDNKRALQKAKAFLKPLYARRHARTEIKQLLVPPATIGPASFKEWLGPGVQGEKLREIARRPAAAQAQWRWTPADHPPSVAISKLLSFQSSAVVRISFSQ